MKKFFIPLLVVGLVACTSSGNKDTAQDSTAVHDTVPTQSLQPATDLVEEGQQEASEGSGMLGKRFDEVKEACRVDSINYFTVTITTSQYEASSDVTWYFDKSFSPRYFKMTWSAEGNEGSTEYFIENKTVVCALDVEGDEEKRWCSTTGGIRTVGSEANGNNKSESLAADYNKLCNDDLKRYLGILKSILKEGEVTEKDENFYTIRTEHKMNVGVEVTESVEVRIPKKVYEALKV